MPMLMMVRKRGREQRTVYKDKPEEALAVTRITRRDEQRETQTRNVWRGGQAANCYGSTSESLTYANVDDDKDRKGEAARWGRIGNEVRNVWR